MNSWMMTKWENKNGKWITIDTGAHKLRNVYEMFTREKYQFLNTRNCITIDSFWKILSAFVSFFQRFIWILNKTFNLPDEKNFT